MAQQVTDPVEFNLRCQISQLQEESGALRMILIRILQNHSREIPSEVVKKAYQALEGNNNAH